jgi:hypothetical protein
MLLDVTDRLKISLQEVLCYLRLLIVLFSKLRIKKYISCR